MRLIFVFRPACTTFRPNRRSSTRSTRGRSRARHHSIAGDRGKGDTPNSSDGVVLYQSSHLDSAQSELIVPGPHGSYDLPQTVAEIQRILHLHLQAASRRARPGTVR